VSEIERRFVHASGTGFPALFLLDLATWQQLQYLLVLATAAAGLLEFLRLYVGLNWSIYDRLTREYEQDNPAGYALYFVSMTAVAFLFEPPVAVPGMLMLTVGDPISGLLGSNEAGRAKRFGVLAAMFAVCFLLAVPFTTSAVPSSAWLVGVAAAAVGATGATLADGVKPVVATYVIDDNLSIPPAACLGIWIVLSVAG
jgi:dolichol kinase